MICFRNNVIPPSWTFKILTEGWDESKTDFKGDVDGFNIQEIPAPPPLVFSLAFQDGGHDQCTSQFLSKNACFDACSASYFL